MKNTITVTILLTLLLIPRADAQQEYIVRTVYFQPTDAPKPTLRIFEALVESQNFYRVEMERHGYGAKTFRLETDVNENIIIQHAIGKHNTEHYLDDTYNRVTSELPFQFTRAANAKDNVLVIIVGGIHLLNTGNRAYGGYFTGNKAGGAAIIAGEALTFNVMAHEIGHTFGLNHAADLRAIMQAAGGSDILLDYETRWLNRHHFFNDTHIRNDLPKFVKSLPIEAIENNRVRFKIVAKSQNDLYHAQMYRQRGGLVIGTAEIQGESATIEVDVRRTDLTDGDHVYIQIMDIHGNKTLKHLGNITLPEPLPDPVPAEPEVVAENEEPAEPEVVVKKIEEEILIDCPGCNPQNDETDLDVRPQFLLTTQWAILKQR